MWKPVCSCDCEVDRFRIDEADMRGEERSSLYRCECTLCGLDDPQSSRSRTRSSRCNARVDEKIRVLTRLIYDKTLCMKCSNHPDLNIVSILDLDVQLYQALENASREEHVRELNEKAARQKRRRNQAGCVEAADAMDPQDNPQRDAVEAEVVGRIRVLKILSLIHI